MRKGCFALVVFLFFYGYSQGNLYASEEDKEYSKIEINLVDFSKKITAYYEKQNLPIPEDFDENKFFEVLKKTYPNQSRIELIQGKFKIKVRATGNNNYSVVLCDLDTDNKLMEDFSCGIKNVEIRTWNKEGRFTCAFEENWEIYCKQKVSSYKNYFENLVNERLKIICSCCFHYYASAASMNIQDNRSSKLLIYNSYLVTLDQGFVL